MLPPRPLLALCQHRSFRGDMPHVKQVFQYHLGSRRASSVKPHRRHTTRKIMTENSNLYGAVAHIQHNFIPTMALCHCFLHRSLHQPTMTAASISAWDVPITHGRASFVTQPRGGCTLVGSVVSKVVIWQRTIRTRHWIGTRSRRSYA